MAQILKFPGPTPKLGFKRVKKRKRLDNPNQLDLFPSPAAQILQFSCGRGSFEQALMLDERGDQRFAAELYAKAIQEQDCVADAYCNLGVIESQLGNTIKAFDCFSAALKHDSRHSESHYNLGNLYFDASDFRLAQLHYEMAAEVEPAFANVYFNLALVRSINQDLEAALAALQQYRRLAPPDEASNGDELLSNLKRCLEAKNDSRSAPR